MAWVQFITEGFFKRPADLDLHRFQKDTVNSVIFARISIPRIALKPIFATLKIRDKGKMYLYQISPIREDFIFTKLRICEVSRK